MAGLLSRVFSRIAPNRDQQPGATTRPRAAKGSPQAITLKYRTDFISQFGLETAHGLEIGPFCDPVFPRDQYPEIVYADVKDTETLKRLARQSPRKDEANVVTVDHVLEDKRLDEVVPHGSLDFVFCSHVLEHVPDMIETLNGVGRILKPGGLFIVFFPDRRFTYDIDRPATTFDQFADRHARKIMRPDPETVEEHFLNNRRVFVGKLWQGLEDGKGPLNFTPEKARQSAAQARKSYIDVHCNVLTDQEFVDMIGQFNAHDLTAMQVDAFAPSRSPTNEFQVALRKPI